MTDLGPPLRPGLIRPAGRDRLRTLALAAGVVALVAGAAAAVLLSPVLLRQVADRSANWGTLSDVGQTYGAASALLSALALAGVAASLFFQARQADGQQIQTVRMLHVELTRMALEEPELFLPSWRPIDAPTIAGKRQHLYQNLLISYVWMSYELSGLREAEVRALLSRIFEGEAARLYWRRVRGGWMPTFVRSSSRRRGRRFIRVVDEEYERAVKAGPATSPAYFDPDPAPDPAPAPVARAVGGGRGWRRAGSPLLLAAGMAAGAAAGALAGRRRRP
jgi:hypothetical protein